MEEQKTWKVKVTSEIEVTAENIDDIMCCALEGGICYWADAARPVGDYLGEYAHEQISRGGKLEIHDNEEDQWNELDRDALLKGIQKAYEDGWYPKYNWCDGKTLDACNIDGEVADCIVQYAIFDNVIYG